MPSLLLILLLLTACPSGHEGAPDEVHPPIEETGAAIADTLEARNFGEIRMGEPMRSRVLAQDPLWERALRVHYDALVMDGHIDTPSHMIDGYQLGVRNHTRAGSGHVDLPKMIEGGLDAPFFVIYVARGYGEGQAATNRALAMIDELKRQVEQLDGIEMAYSAEDVLRITRAGRKAAPMGLEGGHALQGSREVLRRLYDEGIRYVGITHTNTNSWADASQDEARHGGINDLGRELIHEMNRLGVLVDLSHASDDAARDAIAASRAPVIFSHSSVRALVDNVRNVPDDVLLSLRDNGGVIMINFFDPTVNGNLTDDVMAEVYRRIDDYHGGDLRQIWQVIGAVRAERGLGKANVSDIVDHIDYVKNLVGIEHVALGSDFDGVHSLPTGMDSALRLPFITYEMMRRGYSDEEVRLVLGGNTLRVMLEAEEVARRMQAEENQ
jgi:membrane dipeptidase